MSGLIEGWAALAGNAFECAAVASVQIFAIAAATIIAASVGWQLALIRRVRARWPEASSHSRVKLVFVRACLPAGLARTPQLRIGRDVPGACTIGIWSSDVCVSPVLADSLDDEELEAVFLHELAHVTRRDALGSALLLFGVWIGVSLVASGIALALPEGHPGTMRTRLLMVSALISFAVIRYAVTGPGRFLRELTCDDLAVRWSGNPLALASALMKASRFDSPATIAISAIAQDEAFTLNRIARLLDYRPPRVRHMLQRTATVVGMAALAALALL